MTGLFDEIFFLIWVCLCVCHCKKLVTTQRLTAKLGAKNKTLLKQKREKEKKYPWEGRVGKTI